MIQFEKVADINVKYSKLLRSVILSKQDVINMIDEIPVFALIACYASGSTLLNHALELRYKESDRIKAIVYNLKKCGAKISELPDGFVIKKSKLLYSTRIKNFNDHRIAMMCEVLCFISTGRFNNVENKIINTSFPDFYKQISKLYEKI